MLPGKWIAGALVPAIIIVILFYFDHNVSSQMAQRPEFNLRKPATYNYDLALLGLMTLACGLLGLPPVNGVLPQAPMHTSRLGTMRGLMTRSHLAVRATLCAHAQLRLPLAVACMGEHFLLHLQAERLQLRVWLKASSYWACIGRLSAVVQGLAWWAGHDPRRSQAVKSACSGASCDFVMMHMHEHVRQCLVAFRFPCMACAVCSSMLAGKLTVVNSAADASTEGSKTSYAQRWW